MTKIYNNLYKILIYLFLLTSQLLANDYLWPTDASKTITAVFGEIRSYRFHAGIDVRTYGRNGNDLYAISDGYVSRISISSKGYGKAIYITLNDGNTALYAHLSKYNEKIDYLVKEIQKQENSYSIDRYFEKNQLPVKKGDVIGYTGDTGSLSGPHLHFEIRNKKGEPFNPFLTNLKINDTISPIPKKLIIRPTNKNSFINGVPSAKEIDLLEIKENEYITTDTIKVSGNFGISLEVYDLIDGQEFNYGIYEISLNIDGHNKFNTKYNRFKFGEGKLVFSERDFSEYFNKNRKIYNLFTGFNESTSRFISNSSASDYYFDDEGYHFIEIVVSDFNNNQSTIKAVIVNGEESKGDIETIFHKDKIEFKFDPKKIRNINFQLTDRKPNSPLINPNKLIEKKGGSYFLINSNRAFDVISYQALYHNGIKSEIKYLPLYDKNNLPEGDINIVHYPYGVHFKFTEKEFSGYIPILLLKINEEYKKYPFYRIDKNSFISESFHPIDLKDLNNISIYYEKQNLQLKNRIKSIFTSKNEAFNLKMDDLQIIGNGNNFYNDTFSYIQENLNITLPENMKIIKKPFIIGPEHTPLKEELTLCYTPDTKYRKTIEKLGFYKYDIYNNEWDYIKTKNIDDKICGDTNKGGIYVIAIDKSEPTIYNMFPKTGSKYRKKDVTKIEFFIDDELSGIGDEKNIEIILDNKPLIVEYNRYQKKAIGYLNQELEIGEHTIKVQVNDSSNNKKIINGKFEIK